MTQKTKYLPTEPVIPGETLKEHLEAIGMKQTALAKRMGRPIKTINEIIHGKAEITARTALELEKVLGITSEFWLNLELNYRTAKARADAARKLTEECKYVSSFPYAEIANWGWIRKTKKKQEKVLELIKFLGLSSLKQVPKVWPVAYRKCPKYEPSPEAISVWLRKGEIEAYKVETGQYQKKSFLTALKNIKSRMAVESADFYDEMISECSGAGVVLIFVPHLKKTYVNGAARWLSPRRALIQLTIRYRYRDIMLFSLFHEAAHILLHGISEQFIDFKSRGGSEKEAEADKWAANFLIKPNKWRKFIEREDFSKNSVIQFSKEIEVGPDIVVGRLQHERKIGFDKLNYLRTRLEWK